MNTYIANFIVLWIPAVIALVWWRRAGVLSKGLYSSSRTNAIAYVIWLLLGIALNRLGPMPSAQWFLDSIIGVLIAAPLLAMGFSLVLTVWSRFAKRNEQWPMAAGNALMLVLWLMSLIAPN